MPGANAVTTPPLVTEAKEGLLLTHVPPDEGLNVVVVPMHIDAEPVIATVGVAPIVIAEVGSEIHPETVFVNVNVAEPAPTAVTTPLFVTVATAVLLLIQLPPLPGLNVDV